MRSCITCNYFQHSTILATDNSDIFSHNILQMDTSILKWKKYNRNGTKEVNRCEGNK